MSGAGRRRVPRRFARGSAAASRVMLVALCGLAVPVSGCGQDRTSEPVPVLSEAEEAAQDAAREAVERRVDSLRAVLRAEPEHVGARRALVDALAGRGDYQDALEFIAEMAGPAQTELERRRGDLLARTGRLGAARAAYRAAIEARASDDLSARLGLARLDWDAGEFETATAGFDRVIDGYNQRANLTADDLMAVGFALQTLGRRDPALVREAQRAFDEAIATAPNDPAPRVALGRLFLERYNSLDAGELFREAIELEPNDADARFGLAERAAFDLSTTAFPLTLQALAANPNLVEARVQLVAIHLLLEDPESAREQAEKALEVNPVSLEARSAAAAIEYLAGNQSALEREISDILADNPHYAGLFTTLAEAAYRTHKYQDAVDFARRGVEVDPLSWEAYTLLGLNQLRVGQMAEGRATLETAFEGDPFNVWVKNTLDLLDNMAAFERADSENFEVHMAPDEAPLLSIYAPLLAEEAFAALEARYRYRPPTPIRLELFPRHADFSVRTFGLTGLGALGVSFGSVLAMDSPAARDPGTFNWGSTLWHEISHAFTLGYTGHRVPRWLSEGLAVLDERRTGRGWGAQVAPDFLLAFKAGRLPPLDDFNSGFVRPSYPGQVQHSYFLASLLAEMIEDEDGFEAILGLLDAYRDGLNTEEAVRRTLDTDLGRLEERFHAWLETRYATQLASLDDGTGAAPTGGVADSGPPAGPGGIRAVGGEFARNLREGLALFESGQHEAAIEPLERARDLYPQYGGADAPTLALARIHADAGDPEQAIGQLTHYLRYSETHLPAHEQLAELLEAASRPGEAAAILGRTVWIDPYAPQRHARQAGLLETAGEWDAAVVEWRAVLALEPTDRAGALYRLAVAQHRSGDAAGARSSVLAALEIAPAFDEALELLLLLNEGTGR